MENHRDEKGFFQTVTGTLTIAFCVILAAFVLMLTGIHLENDILCLIGFIMTAAAMLYSPI